MYVRFVCGWTLFILLLNSCCVLARSRSQVFVKRHGPKRHPSVRHVTAQHAYEALAYRVYIQGQQAQPSGARKDRDFLAHQFEGAAKYFTSNLPANMCFVEPDLARRLNSALCIQVGTELESRLAARFRAVLSSFGEVICCDEKVFEFNSAKSGMLRVIPAKHQKGLWNYTMCVYLSCGLAYLIDTRCATEISDLDEHVTMPAIIQHQIDIAQSKNVQRAHKSCMVWDSYYLTILCVQMLREQRVPFVAPINSQRFEPIVALLTDHVQASGEMCFAVRQPDRAGDAKELATCFYSPDSKKGKRFTLTSYLVQVDHKRRKGHIPGFDEYQSNFSGCDSFNRRLHDKSWPHHYGGKSYSVEVQAGYDFLFTCALVNVHHLWKELSWNDRKIESFADFTAALALELLQLNYL